MPFCGMPNQGISIHALREEGDSFSFSNRPVFSSFLSTPSARRATFCFGRYCSVVNIFLSTPSARRATIDQQAEIDSYLISIHALREEGDQYSGTRRPSLNAFLSTPSARRATADKMGIQQNAQISIHALREEGDPKAVVEANSTTISIHALREEGDARLRVRACMSL